MTTSHQSPEKPQSEESPFRFERPIIRGGVVLLLTAVVLGSAGCSKLRNDSNTAGRGGHAGQRAQMLEDAAHRVEARCARHVDVVRVG